MQCVVCSVCHVIYCTIFRESEQSDDGRVARRELSYEDRMYSWKRKNKTRKGKEKQRVARLWDTHTCTHTRAHTRTRTHTHTRTRTHKQLAWKRGLERFTVFVTDTHSTHTDIHTHTHTNTHSSPESADLSYLTTFRTHTQHTRSTHAARLRVRPSADRPSDIHTHTHTAHTQLACERSLRLSDRLSCTHTHTHMHTHTRKRTHTHTRTHTHMHTHSPDSAALSSFTASFIASPPSLPPIFAAAPPRELAEESWSCAANLSINSTSYDGHLPNDPLR